MNIVEAQIHVKDTDGILNISVEGAMNIYNAEQLKTDLIQKIAGQSEIELDLSGVNEMDTSGFQIIVLLKREAALTGSGMRLASASSAVLNILDLFNMKSSLMEGI